MMEAADLGNDYHSPHRAPLHRSWLGGIFLERQMSPAGMIVVDVLSQDSPEVSLVEDDHVVETLAPNASNQPFDVRILPRRARRRPNLVDADSCDALAEVPIIDSISLSQHEARSTLPGKGIDNLLGGPLCRRAVCGIEVSDPSPIVTKNDE